MIATRRRGFLFRHIGRRAAALLLFPVLVAGCENKSPTSAPVDIAAAKDPLAGAPVDWDEFLRWSAEQLTRVPDPLPPPQHPRLAEPRWPIVRLDDLFVRAQVASDWIPAQTQDGPLASVGPFPPASPTFQMARVENPRLGPMHVFNITGFRVDREQVGRVEVQMRAPTGRFVEMFWGPGSSFRLPIPDHSKPYTYQIPTSGFVDWAGPLEKLNLRTDGAGDQTPEINYIRFYGHEGFYPDAAGVWPTTIQRERRNSIYAHGKSEILIQNVTLPKGARFHCGLARFDVGAPPAPASASAPASAPAGPAPLPSAAAQFELLIESDGQSQSLLTDQADVGATWKDVSRDLAAFAGKSVSLRLRSSCDPQGVAAWGNPVIYEPVADPPCVVLYLIDTAAALHMNLYGAQRDTVPNLAALAQRGAWMANAHANSPVTMTSIPNMMFSMSPERHGVYADSMIAPEELVSLAEAMRAGGFLTASFVTNLYAGPRQGLDQGFDHFVDRIDTEHHAGADRTIPLEEVMRWLGQHRDRPTFVYVHTAEPHAPYTPPPGFAGKFDPDYSGPIDGTLDPQRGFQASRTVRDVQHAAALYDEELAYADSRLGLFVKAIEQAKQLDRTTLFAVADHGEEFQEHGNWTHGQGIFEVVLRIPMVAAGPLIAQRGRLEQPAQLFDIMPTILDLVDLPVPYAMAGASLRTLIGKDAGAMPSAEGTPQRADANSSRTIFVTHHFWRSEGMVEYAAIEPGGWKLSYNRREEQSEPSKTARNFALYDLKTDPGERRNLLDAQRDTARRLIGELLRYARLQIPYRSGLERDQIRYDAEQMKELKSLGYID